VRYGFVLTNLAGGGAEKAVLNIGAALAARGHRVDVILLEDFISYPVPPGVAIHLACERSTRIAKGWLGKRLAALRLARTHARLRQEHEFDVIISTLPFADEVAIAARLPRLWSRIANTLSAEIDRLRSTGASKADRRLRRYRRLYAGRQLLAVSQGVAEDLRGPLGLGTARIEVIPNPFDFEGLRRQAREAAPLPLAPYIVHAGRFSPQKRHDVLLDAYVRLDVPHLLVLLTDPSPELSAMIAQRGLVERVRVAGFQQNPYPWIAAADLLVLSSDHEGLPNVLIEALVLGTPVVSTDCPSGPREILGAALPELLAPVGDPAALARAIDQALATRPALGSVDLRKYEVGVVTQLYENLAARSHPARTRPCAASSA